MHGAVERRQRFARHAAPHRHRAADFVAVKGVHWHAQLKHHIVCDVDNIINRTNTAGI